MTTSLDHLFHYDDKAELLPEVERVAMDILNREFSERIEISAAANAAVQLMNAGMRVEMKPQEEKRAQKIFREKLTPTRADLANPAVVIKLEALLNEYDRNIVHEASQIRRFVTNRLLEEADPQNKNAAQRLKALELLGKITEVGLFTEQSVITVQQMPTQELEADLHKTLTVLLDPADYTTTLDTYTPPTPDNDDWMNPDV